MEQLPIFVYGTLLPGQPNYWVWAEAIESQQPANFPNGRLFDLGHYPMLVNEGEMPVRGALVTVKPGLYTATLARLDALEGYDPESPVAGDYFRVKCSIMLEDEGEAEAWVYLGKAGAAGDAPSIESGDWLAHSAANLARLEEWWAGLWPRKAE